jgi:hypothetical protein
MKYTVLGLAAVGGGVMIFLLLGPRGGSDDVGGGGSPNAGQRPVTSTPVVFNATVLEQPIERQKQVVRAILNRPATELQQALDALNEGELMRFRILAAQVAADDINRHGDYALARFFIAHPWCMTTAGVLNVLKDAKSPNGAEDDLRIQRELVTLILKESRVDDNHATGIRIDMLRCFGAVHGASVVQSGKMLPLDDQEFLQYMNGVARTTREAVFGNLLLAESKTTHRTATLKAVNQLLASNAKATSAYLSGMPPSATKDLAVLGMIHWLAKRKADDEARPWLDQVGSDEIRQEAEMVLGVP